MMLFRIRCLVLQLLLLSTTQTTNCATTPSSPSRDYHDVDEVALVAVKAKISRHSGVLDSWNQSTNYCSWDGVTCGRRHPWRVVGLNLSFQGLIGTISPAIGNLTFLRSLNLSSNGLQGEISPSIGYLRRLRRIDLGHNMLTGVIPINISRCISLRIILIQHNKGLQGSIPAEIGNLPSLSILALDNNSITGTIPSSLGNLSQLAVLLLMLNYLEGPIPAGIGNNPYLKWLQLSINNLSGLLPPSMFNLSSVYLFFVANNKLRGHLPSDLSRSLPSIKKLGIGGNRFTGSLPPSLTNLSTLQILDMGRNNFTGVVPTKLGRLQNLEMFAVDENMLEAKNEEEWEFIGSLVNCSGLQKLTFGWNSFAGKLPGSLVNLSTNLKFLVFPNNRISGVIPLDIGNLVGLERLDFKKNLLTRDIPASIGKLTRLKQLSIYLNYHSGHLPSSIANLSNLLQLYANDNSLEGPIPPSIGKLSKLLYLDLSNNKLTGMIPSETMELPSISMLLDLPNNMLEGPLPLEVGSLVHLEQLFLLRNKLSGEIPDTIGNCRVMENLLMDGNSFQGSIPATFKNIAGLAILNLTNNKLNGSIPSNLATLTNLQELYLRHNNLSGSIPELLGNLPLLLRLDLSYNNLQGEVPKGGVFKNLTGLSIVGNNALCGGIPQLHLSKCPRSYAGKNKKAIPKFLRIGIPTIGSLILLFLVWAGFQYRKSKTILKKDLPPPFAEIELPIVSYNDILKGTNGFSERHMLGKGKYGTVYKGTLENQAIAVKVFNVQQSGSYKSFQAECEALRRVKHRCLLKIVTCCSSINHQGQDFRAIVFEFMINGSLDRWIHSDDLEGQDGQGALILSQRLDIAVDIVDALDYLHNGCQPSIIHCDIKPSNILLNQDMRARVGDFGIASVLDEATSNRPVNSASTLGIRCSIGYIAPEYGEGVAVSTCGDMFSLGVTLLELFTAKRPTNDMFRDGRSLHGYAEAALPDKVMEIADSNLWLHDEASSSNDTRHITRTKKCLSAVHSAWCPLLKAIAHRTFVNKRCYCRNACYQR